MALARALVVDDERFFREAIQEVLAEAGIPCVVAATGAEALDLAQDASVGVVVLDLQLPDMHGLEVFRILRDRRPELRVVILSAHTDQENVLEALRLGAFDYLAKPLHEEELSLAVRRALDAYGNAVGWTRLRERLARLEDTLSELWARARSLERREDPQDLRRSAVQAAAEILGAARTSLMLLDEDTAELRVAAVHGGKLAPDEMDSVGVGEGVAGSALARVEPILVADVRVDPRFAGRAQAHRYGSTSFAVAPLVAGARALGVLCATDRPPDAPFAEEDLALLRILSVQLAQMLDPQQVPGAGPEVLAEEGGPDAEEGAAADLARAVCEAVTAEVEPARILQAALRPVASRLEAAPVSLYLSQAGGGELLREAEVDGALRTDRPVLPTGRGLCGTVLETGLLVATDAPEADPRFDPEVDTPADGRPGPLLCGPLRFRGKTLGLFRVFPPRGRDASAEVGEVLAAALSAAVRNVLLYRSLVETIDEVAQARREAGR